MSTFETLPFYRGVSTKYPTDRPTILTPRSNRLPRNSSPEFHKAANQWFERRFGIPYRSRGVFLTSRVTLARSYAKTPAHVMRILPISTYQYCWSPKISDLLYGATRLATSSASAIEAYLDAAQYCEDGLREAHAAGHEVMLYCQQYVAIPIGLLGVEVEPSQLPVIV